MIAIEESFIVSSFGRWNRGYVLRSDQRYGSLLGRAGYRHKRRGTSEHVFLSAETTSSAEHFPRPPRRDKSACRI